ncbi:hypothetical protein SSP531S_26840 [Streptomyces spongiicola]|uniref:Lipoprotein n=1 Tax=Streptomyces spongiicola TaxID=1690221 RepID=A0A2S1YW84_9ACTN|nr:hypothetical protein [Streptomyces spongiicola]AWK07988.1 hypothetical protein DDQ41_02500 [Streptomyces spongiicola]GBQ01251.1 hypothetical protein SSP531S_26840 [Streptomyces spongiicola]
MADHRRLGIAAGAVLLTAALTGCSGLGRTAVGTVNYEAGAFRAVTVSNPVVTGCHRLLPAGAVRIENATLIDLIAYRTPDCTGGDTTYIATTLFDNIAPGTQPWLSYRWVH